MISALIFWPVSGVIDRLVLIYKGEHLMAADILDYKTDKLNADNTDEVKAKEKEAAKKQED